MVVQPSPGPAESDPSPAPPASTGLGGLSGPMPRQMTGRFRRADSGVRPGSTVDVVDLREAVAAERAAAAAQAPVAPEPPSVDPIGALADRLAANPADVRLRMRFARALLDQGDTTSAATQVSLVLQQQPGNAMAQALLQATMAATVSALRQPTSAPPTAPLITF